MSKERRLSRIFAKDGKSVTLALDGYYFSTKTNGIDNTINQLLLWWNTAWIARSSRTAC